MTFRHSYRNFAAAALLTALLVLLGTALPAAAQSMDDMPGMQHASKPAAATPLADIVRDPAEVPPPVGNRAPAIVKVELTAVEVMGQLDPDAHTTYRYWTFNGKLP